jgi:hypothetical protein
MQSQFSLPISLEVFKQDAPRALGILMIAILFLAISIFVAISIAFVFHWRKYGDGGKTIKNAEWIFLAGGVAILFMMTISLIAYYF